MPTIDSRPWLQLFLVATMTLSLLSPAARFGRASSGHLADGPMSALGREYSFAWERHDRLLYSAFQPVCNPLTGRLLMTLICRSPKSNFSIRKSS